MIGDVIQVLEVRMRSYADLAKGLLVLAIVANSCVALASEPEVLNFGDYVGRIYSDGSGSLGKRFDPSVTMSCKSFACEYDRKNADANTSFKDIWSFRIKNDEMTDAQVITVERRPYKISQEFGEMRLTSNVYLWLNLSDSNKEVLCVAGHDFPGMKAMIRVDSNAPIETNEKGCLLLTKSLDGQMRTGSEVTIRGYHWPYRGAETFNIDLGGYIAITEYLRRIRQ